MAVDIALRWLCACLSAEERFSAAEVECIMRDAAFDWDKALLSAHRGLAATQLYPALCRRGLTERAPGDWRAHVETMQQLNLQRNALLRDELLRAANVLNREGIEPVLLKGGLALLPGQPPEYAARLMGDIDLLLPAAAVPKCQRLLQAHLGYRPCSAEEAWEDCHHAAPLLHPGHEGKFELHRGLFSDARALLLPAEEVLSGSLPVRIDGVRLRMPQPSHRLLHTLVHALPAGNGSALAGADLRHFYDMAVLREQAENRIDWDMIADRLGKAGYSARLHAYLLVVQALFEQPLPAAIRPGIRGRFEAWRLVGTLQGHRRAVLLDRGEYWGRRLCRLPRRLAAPSWYRMKYAALRRGAPI